MPQGSAFGSHKVIEIINHAVCATMSLTLRFELTNCSKDIRFGVAEGFELVLEQAPQSEGASSRLCLYSGTSPDHPNILPQECVRCQILRMTGASVQ